MEKNESGTAVAAARSAAEGKIGAEAASRAGHNPNLKGIVHEVMVKDRYNADPRRLLDGSEAILAKSPTAVRDDVLIMRDGRVVGRMQLKDTPASAGDVIRRVQSKQYAGTRLCGTEETVQAYDRCAAAARGKPVTQKMTSTGISSDDTARVAIQTIGDGAGKLTAQMVGKVAASSGAAGAAVSGGLAALTSGVQLLEGDIDGSEFAGNVADAAVKGGLSAAGASVAGTAASAGVATVLAGTAASPMLPAIAGVAAALGAGAAIAGGWRRSSATRSAPSPRESPAWSAMSSRTLALRSAVPSMRPPISCAAVSGGSEGGRRGPQAPGNTRRLRVCSQKNHYRNLSEKSSYLPEQFALTWFMM